MDYLSVIISFANEKNEVERTLKSIRKYSPRHLPIILINDASDDGYDYSFLGKKYNTEYIINSSRLGVAKSRDMGVNISKTPFFILLDAHMRFYDKKWHSRIVNVLQENKRALLCCQTKNIRREKVLGKKPTGAKLLLDNGNDVFETIWNFEEKKTENPIEEIPCVLGAAYATSKEYWNYLKGLDGLLSYGGDEAYISTKVWLEGGKCLLIKDIIVGHLYRKEFPYDFNNVHILYNKILTMELLFPTNLKSRLISKMKWVYRSYPEMFNKAYGLLDENQLNVSLLKEYYKTIFTHHFSYFQKINDSYFSLENESDEIIDVDEIAMKLILSIDNSSIGLYKGLMARVLFFMHYSKFRNNLFFENLAYELLNVIYDKINVESPIGLENGLCGIGWGIEYLIKNHLFKGDSNEILADIDKQLMIYKLNEFTDYSISTGTAGILYYILTRINTSTCIFNEYFLIDIQEAAQKIISNACIFEGVDIAICIIDKLKEKDNVNLGLEINEIVNFDDNQIEEASTLSLNGLIGKSILIMIKDEKK